MVRREGPGGRPVVPEDAVGHHHGDGAGGRGGGEGGGERRTEGGPGGGAAGGTLVIVGRAGVETFLLLSAVTEPDPHHLPLHVQRVRDECDLFTGGFRILVKCSLQGDPNCGVNGSSLLPPPIYRVLLCRSEKVMI